MDFLEMLKPYRMRGLEKMYVYYIFFKSGIVFVLAKIAIIRRFKYYLMPRMNK